MSESFAMLLNDDGICLNVWSIGDLNIDGRVVLGPMSGYTTASYRAFMKPFGVGLSFTEMISDTGVIHGVGRTLGYMRFTGNHPTGMQLFGHDPDRLALAAERALVMNPEVDLIDINMSCPVRKVTRNGSGSVLMRDPELCGRIIRAVKAAVDVPVTAKIRLGWTLKDANYRDVLDELESAEVDAVSFHPRAQSEHYAGCPHYDEVEGIRGRISVPLIISGNIYSLGDAVYALEKTGADAVMVARGGIGNPMLIKQIDTYLRTGETVPNPTVSQQTAWCRQLTDMMIEEKGHDLTIRNMRSIAPKFIAGCHSCRDYRRRLAEEPDSRESLFSLLDEIDSRMGDQTVHADGRIPMSDQ